MDHTDTVHLRLYKVFCKIIVPLFHCSTYLKLFIVLHFEMWYNGIVKSWAARSGFFCVYLEVIPWH